MSDVVACDVPDCDDDAYGRGMCVKHYYRWKRSGSVGEPQRARPLTEEELVRLRRAVGVPDEGPGTDERKRWHQQEVQGVSHGQAGSRSPEGR